MRLQPLPGSVVRELSAERRGLGERVKPRKARGHVAWHSLKKFGKQNFARLSAGRTLGAPAVAELHLVDDPVAALQLQHIGLIALLDEAALAVIGRVALVIQPPLSCVDLGAVLVEAV